MNEHVHIKDLPSDEMLKLFLAQEVAALRGMIRAAPSTRGDQDIAMMDHLLQMVLMLALGLEEERHDPPASIRPSGGIPSVRRRVPSRR